ncbi:MAG: DUF4388 domain-containing protein [Myxococcales bacterium]|nr:DUF4388 domain-containing protein [Myxococcales bacterium]
MLDNQKFGKRLVQAGVINQAQLDEALRQQQVQEGRLGEILVRLGYVSESTVLQFLAAEFRTRYVSTERLAKARIPQQVLDLLPLSIAEHYHLIPVLYDPENSTLSIVTSDPQNEASLREVHMITRVRELRVYVALQSAVQAAIRKHYRGDINAFAPLLQAQGTPYPEDHNTNSQPPEYSSPYPDSYNVSGGYSGYYEDNPGAQFGNPPGTPSPYGRNMGGYYDPYAPMDPNAMGGYGNDPSAYPEPYGDNDDDVTRIHANFHEALYEQPPAEQQNALPAYEQNDIYANQYQAPPQQATNLLALTKLFTQRIQRESAVYRRHLSLQEPILRLLVKRLNMTQPDSESLWMAFYLHHIDTDLPKASLISLEQNEHLLADAQKQHAAHVENLRMMGLPNDVMNILQHVYERFDGQGFPNQVGGNHIPLGARILSILDAYEYLRIESDIKGEELNQQVRNYEGTLFDSELLPLVGREVQRIQDYEKGAIPNVLLLDPDAQLAGQLEKSLLDKGWWVQVVAESREAETILNKHRPDLVVLELNLPGEMDGFSFVEHIRKQVSNPPDFIFLTSQHDDENVDRGMSMALDYLIKPAGPNVGVTVARINRSMEQVREQKRRKNKSSGSKGLTGSLEQLGLPDLLQVLSQSRRTGRLTISAEDETGYIYLEDGHIFDASLSDTQGEHAVYHLLSWEKGEFSLDPSVRPEKRAINKSLDGLILDGLRMIDEARRDGADEISFGDDFDDEFSDDSGDTGGSENDFFDLSSFEESGGGKQPKEVAPPAPAPEPAKRSGEFQGLFQDLQEGDLEDAFSSTFVGDELAKKSESSS